MTYKKIEVSVPYMNNLYLECSAWSDGRGLLIVRISNGYSIYHHSMNTCFPIRIRLLRDAKIFLDVFYDRFPDIDWTVDDLEILHKEWSGELISFGASGLEKLLSEATA